MAKVYSELERAQLQNNSGNLTGPVEGLVFLDTAINQAKAYANAAWHTFMDLDTAQTATNKTFTSPTINGGALSGTFSGTPTFSGDITFSSTGAIRVPVGDTAARPAGATGKIRYNTDTNSFEGYSSTWSALGGGGGGGGFSWNEPGGSSPTRNELAGEKVFDFEDGITQNLYGWVKVPSGYGGGSQIKMKIAFATTSAGTNDQRMESVATLVQPGDAITSTTNQRTSTNADTTLSGTSNALNVVELDLTDTAGAINAVAVAAGDLILVNLYREAPTGTEDTNDIHFIPSATEVTFS